MRHSVRLRRGNWTNDRPARGFTLAELLLSLLIITLLAIFAVAKFGQTGRRGAAPAIALTRAAHPSR